MSDEHKFDPSLLDGPLITVGDLKSFLSSLPDNMPLIEADEGSFAWFSGRLPDVVDACEVHFEHPATSPSIVLDYERAKKLLNAHKVVKTFKALLHYERLIVFSEPKEAKEQLKMDSRTLTVSHEYITWQNYSDFRAVGQIKETKDGKVFKHLKYVKHNYVPLNDQIVSPLPTNLIGEYIVISE